MTTSAPQRANTVVQRVVALRRLAPSSLFTPDDPDDAFAVRCAQLWTNASARARRLGVDEPSALSIECRAGAVVAVREGGRVLVGVVASGAPASVARYELGRMFAS